MDTKDIIAATISGHRVDVYVDHNGDRLLRPPYGGGGYVTEDQWHLLSNTVFHTKTVQDTLEDLKLMEASGTSVFFRFSIKEGKSDKTDIMTPEAARSFLDTAEYLGIQFNRLHMLRAEYF